MTEVPVTTTYVMTFAPGKSVADLQIESVCEAFAFLRPSHVSSVYLFCKRLPNGTGILGMTAREILSEPSNPSIVTAVPIAHSVVFGLCQLETRLPRGLAS